MKYLILLSLISLTACKELNEANSTGVDETLTKGRKIVGGFEAPNVISYQAALVDAQDNSPLCGGSIISRNWILTAAHCLLMIEALGKTFYVRIGSRSYESGGQAVQVQRSISHPSYVHGKFDFDVALLQVDNIQFNNQVSPIQLPQENQLPPDGTTVLVYGWGRTISNIATSHPYYLRVAYLQVTNWSQCKQMYSGFLTTRMICATGERMDTCQGDSGGPLVSENTQIGIVSFGWGCALPGVPKVFANVANSDIRRFIRENSGI